MIVCLVKDSVTIITGQDNHAKAYCNNISGRTVIIAEQPPKIVADVIAVWGDTPTVMDNDITTLP